MIYLLTDERIFIIRSFNVYPAGTPDFINLYGIAARSLSGRSHEQQRWKPSGILQILALAGV
jgi:hypothetical protein